MPYTRKEGKEYKLKRSKYLPLRLLADPGEENDMEVDATEKGDKRYGELEPLELYLDDLFRMSEECDAHPVLAIRLTRRQDARSSAKLPCAYPM